MSLASLSRTPSFSDEQQYRLIYAASFLFFLAATAYGRVARRLFARRDAQPDVTRSLVAEAKAATSNALLYAFLG